MKYLLFLTLFASSIVNAAASDTGTISNLYIDGDDKMAIKLDNGFPNASVSGECASSNGWAGLDADAPASMKSVLLAAKASQSPVSVSIYGCTIGGGWYKIGAIYVN